MTRGRIIHGLYRDDAISKASVFEILGNLMSIPYDFDRQITEKDVSESMDEIRALPFVQSKQIECEDAISRADAVKVASGYCHPSNIAKELAKLPPVTPQPKVGHWINKSEQDAVTLKIYECSECGKFAYRDFDYCPNCGSDNRVRDKE
jgi:hypothetical protein